MHPHIEYPKLERALKRSFSRFLDGCGSESLRPTKRHRQLPPSPPATANLLDNALQPARRDITSPSSPCSLQLPKKRALFDDDPTSLPVQKKSRLEEWLENIPASAPRPASCPPQIGYSRPPQNAPEGKGQPLSFANLQAISRTQEAGAGASVAGSTRSSRQNPAHAGYRGILRNNGIWMDLTGEKIPPELRNLLDSHILKKRSSILFPAEIAKAVKTVKRISDSPEGNIYDLTDTALLPIKDSVLGRGGNTPWSTHGLPKNENYGIPLAAPKPDIHLGYATDQASAWKVEEDSVTDHHVAARRVQPAKGNSFPFFLVEFKSEAMGANVWQAENQAAGGGACSVNAAYWIHKEAEPSKEQSVLDSIAFSACATHRLIVFHMHFYIAKERQHYMSWIATCDTLRQVQESNHVVESILEYGVGPRQTKIREALAKLWPIPGHWKLSRPASVMDSQELGTDDVGASTKSRRTE